MRMWLILQLWVLLFSLPSNVIATGFKKIYSHASALCAYGDVLCLYTPIFRRLLEDNWCRLIRKDGRDISGREIRNLKCFIADLLVLVFLVLERRNVGFSQSYSSVTFTQLYKGRSHSRLGLGVRVVPTWDIAIVTATSLIVNLNGGRAVKPWVILNIFTVR